MAPSWLGGAVALAVARAASAGDWGEAIRAAARDGRPPPLLAPELPDDLVVPSAGSPPGCPCHVLVTRCRHGPLEQSVGRRARRQLVGVACRILFQPPDVAGRPTLQLTCRPTALPAREPPLARPPSSDHCLLARRPAYPLACPTVWLRRPPPPAAGPLARGRPLVADSPARPVDPPVGRPACVPASRPPYSPANRHLLARQLLTAACSPAAWLARCLAQPPGCGANRHHFSLSAPHASDGEAHGRSHAASSSLNAATALDKTSRIWPSAGSSARCRSHRLARSIVGRSAQGLSASVRADHMQPPSSLCVCVCGMIIGIGFRLCRRNARLPPSAAISNSREAAWCSRWGGLPPSVAPHSEGSVLASLPLASPRGGHGLRRHL